jgi:hypothetical protein
VLLYMLSLKVAPSPYARPEYADAARTPLAKSIISSARRGEWNQQTLAEEVLFYVACQKLSRLPPATKL